MRRFLTIAAAMAALGACAHMNSGTPDAIAAEHLGTNADIAAETTNLNHITRVSLDATRLYDQAADKAKDKNLQTALRSISAERKVFAQQLQQRVAALGGKPVQTGETSGATYPSFTALPGLAENDSAAAAGEAYRGETYVIDEMNKALATKLTKASQDMVAAELAQVKAGLSKVETLKAGIETKQMNEAARKDAAAQPKPQPANPG